MLIGDDECYLRIERSDSSDWYAPVRVEARLVLEDRAEFFGLNSLVMIQDGEEDRAAFTEFAELRRHGLTLVMSDEGSLELRRDVHGNINVLFSIGYRRVGPHWKVSGDIRVDGEHTQEFLREFRKAVFGAR